MMLIEVLVTIAIMSIIAAIATFAVIKIRTEPIARRTRTTTAFDGAGRQGVEQGIG
jgi:prepilin-type N-terminal cleavage/methylation domain-containing protein